VFDTSPQCSQQFPYGRDDRIPRNGDVFIEYEGIPYVMIESAGPAWLPPGEVGETTSDYLGAGNNFRIQPLTL